MTHLNVISKSRACCWRTSVCLADSSWHVPAVHSLICQHCSFKYAIALHTATHQLTLLLVWWLPTGFHTKSYSGMYLPDHRGRRMLNAKTRVMPMASMHAATWCCSMVFYAVPSMTSAACWHVDQHEIMLAGTLDSIQSQVCKTGAHFTTCTQSDFDNAGTHDSACTQDDICNAGPRNSACIQCWVCNAGTHDSAWCSLRWSPQVHSSQHVYKFNCAMQAHAIQHTRIDIYNAGTHDSACTQSWARNAGNPYADEHGAFGDNVFRYTLLSMAACEAPLVLPIGGYR